ncbi:MAG: T9SS type A sorting domain-containing protein [Bacteroidia bacterium]|nr:T9SS type A sorting domain-containing protein [Sphingobacteriaceae bacterium]MBK7309221.1 T9SS type A sorting domain-containing protein [Sphingobacteriaceae bacterium]MBK7818631.1 T9SS type A sorting domain-containing protein [Sphingobacteriaceae bacterium]MBP9068190.1 T9SS type A sorting domain-containing protein [Bacteroidia bacterium]
MRINLFCILLVFSGTLMAQWNSDPAVNASVAIVTKSQDNLHTVSDANGGAIISWDDNRNSSTNATDIFAQRINASGIIKWATNGIAICNNSAHQQSSAIADAEQGNAIITWEDIRLGNYDIYAQKIDSSGNIQWAANGIAICSKSTHQKNPKIVGDNAGGAIIVWEDSVNNFWDIYAQRVSSTGAVLWTTGGVGICVAGNTQINPKIESDGLGGAIITWQDKRNNVDYDIYAQRIDNNGTVQWAADGVVICNSINTQSNPRIEPDGSNGAIIGWIDKRNAIDNNIYGQRINSTGIVQWAANGNSICGASGSQSALDIKYTGSNGTVFTWKDARTATTSVYAQLVSLSGANQLIADGILISNGLKSNNPNAVSDKQNGFIIAWQDSSGTGWDIKTQRLDATGNTLWLSGGVIVSNASNNQINAVQISDNNGGAIYFWEDYRNAADYNIYAHHLYSSGSPDIGIDKLHGNNSLKALCFPNPITNNSIIKLTENSYVNNWQLQIFDSQGRSIVTKTLSNNDTFLINTNDYTAGIYFYMIKVNQTTLPLKGSFISTFK